MMMHLRAGPASGTLINRSGNIIKVDTKTAFNKAGSYPSWHPSGKIIAFSVNQLSLFFHSTGECRDVLDHNSDIIIYLIESNTVTTCPDISNPDRMETFPTWSPDGRYLYFCSSPKLESYMTEKDGKEDLLYNEIRYDLMRISYDSNSGIWGNLETVLSSKEIGLSITEPRISQDGRFLLFTTAKYGNFPIYLKSSDVCILDLKTGKYNKPDINSDNTDSFHSWSSNSRWFVFSSKRVDGFCARPYFSYIDQNGKVYKPFVLPQKDPEFYASFLKTYNVPELIKGPVTVRPQDLIETAYNPDKFLQAKLDPKVKPRQTSDKPLKDFRNQPQ
jgi:Tol biopolymer transport system component